MQLWPLLEDKLIDVEHPFISVTGGGGKTTFLVEFGKYLKKRGRSVLLTTTTKLSPPEMENYGTDHIHLSLSSLLSSPLKKGESVLFARQDERGAKLYYPGEDAVCQASAYFDAVLCEADGSRHLPVKIHTSRDPVILSRTTAVVALMGIWCIGKRTGEAAFGEERDRVIDRDYLQEYMDSPEGLCKGMSDKSENIILFNGGDDMSREEKNVLSSLVIPPHVSAYIVSERKGAVYNAF